MSKNIRWTADDLKKKGLAQNASGDYVPVKSLVNTGKVDKIEPGKMIPHNKRVDDKTLIEAYIEHGNLWKVAEMVGLCGQSVHERLQKLGVEMNNPAMTEAEKERIRAVYESGIVRGDNKLKELSDEIGRSIPLISRYAKEMGLTSYSRSNTEELNSAISKRTIEHLDKKGHPRGMLNKTHTDETKAAMSAASKKMWSDPNHVINSDEEKQRRSDVMTIRMSERTNEQSSNDYSRVKHGHVIFGERKIFVRSSWEGNIAAYLEFQKVKGLITDWEYESDTFWFEAILRGVRSYKPDFKITRIDGSIYFIEVKGWMDLKSATKLKRMKKYHPDVIIELIDQQRYKEICKLKNLIPGWGQLGQ